MTPAEIGHEDVTVDLTHGHFAAGTVIAERYRVVRLLGRGGMGAVYHADDLILEVQVALKFLTSSREKEPEKVELLLNEVRLARQITHPNVCRVYDVGEIEGLHFLSMEYIDGEDLSSLLKRVGCLPKDRAIELSLEICRGLGAAHERGILHRDLKPANLMIDAAGKARITDFGLASFTGDPTESAVLAGTPIYMAPEQITGQISVRSDLYALGLVFYELFTGRKPFSRPQIFLRGAPETPPPLAVDGLAPGVERAILKCLETDPADRPSSVEEVARELERGAVPIWRPAVGAVIPHRAHWALEKRLGEGGFGEAWLAGHKKTGEKRVFKFCHDVAKLRTFQREITLFRLLKEELGRRDDITSILDWSLEEHPYFIESEYSAGGNLREWAKTTGGLDAVPLATRLEIVAQVATALAAAHSVGVMHKDVKPSNILVGGEPEEPRAQLCDFGIGALTETGRLETAGITVLGLTETESHGSSYAGTRLYMAPELLEGKGATLHADVYALGVVLYQMAVGDFSRALAPGWDRDIEDPLLREDIAAAVEGSPERRLGAALLAERLRSLPERHFQREEQARLRREAELVRSTMEKARRRRKWAAAALGFLLFLAVVLVVAFERGARTAEAALIEQTLESHQGMARIAAAAVDRNLSAVVRRVEREARDERIVALFERGSRNEAIQAHTDLLYEDYKDRHFYSWVTADRRATARARSPFDAGVVGQSYGYREWFTGKKEEPVGSGAARPRGESGLTLAFQSTAEGHPTLMSVAAPIRSRRAAGSSGEESAAGEILGVLAATLHVGTFNRWLEVTEQKTDGAECPERFILLLNRGQLLRHPCPEPGAPQPPVAPDRLRASADLEELLERGASRRFHDPLRPRSYEVKPADLAVAAPLPEHPDWTVIVVQDRGAALRPLTRMTSRLRLLGQIAMGIGFVVLTLLVGVLWRAGRQKGWA